MPPIETTGRAVCARNLFEGCLKDLHKRLLQQERVAVSELNITGEGGYCSKGASVTLRSVYHSLI